MKSFIIALLFVLLSSVAFADPPPLNTPVPDAGYPNPSTTGVTLFTGLNAQAGGAYPQGSWFHCGGMSTVRFKVSGTFTGTLTFYYSMDGGSSWDLAHCYTDGGSTAVTSTTAPGYWYFPCAGANLFGVGFSSYGTGSANAFARGTMVSVKPPSGGGGGSWVGAILRNTSDQTISPTTGGSWTDLSWNATDVDTASGFANPYYTIPTSAYYEVTAQVQNQTGGGHAARLELVLSDGTVLAADQTPGTSVTLGAVISGLVAYWQMNEASGTIIYDTSGGGHNAGQTSANIVSGHGQANARDTNGGHYIMTGHTYPGPPVTFAFWMSWLDTNGYASIFDAGNSSSFSPLLSYGGTHIYWQGSGYMSSGTIPSDGSWHHVVLTIDAGSNLVWYFDTTYGGSSGVTASEVNNLVIGCANDTGRNINANFQDFQIYNRVLTSTEINMLYSNAHSSDGAGNMIAASTSNPPNGLTLNAHCVRHFTAGDQIKVHYWNDGPGDTIQTLSTYSPVFTIHKQ